MCGRCVSKCRDGKIDLHFMDVRIVDIQIQIEDLIS